MMRSLYSGISGLRVHQTQMDVIGNNIANVNTVAFKASRVTFQEILNQTIKNASGPSQVGGRGGTNPQQIGLGVSVGSIDVLHTSTGVQRTDRATDLAIDGEGFFMVSDGENVYYTRAGNFDIDVNGDLVYPGGLKVLGWNTLVTDPTTGQQYVDTAGAPGPINLLNLSMPAKATDMIEFEGNLDAGLAVGETVQYSFAVFDSLGNEHKLNIVFQKNNPNNWTWRIEAPTGSGINVTGSQGTLQFDENGKLDMDSSTIPTDITINPNTGAAQINLNIEFDGTKFTQYANSTTVNATANGYTSGILNSISIDSEGRVIGYYTNGQSREDAVLAIATFTNPAGLNKVGNNLYQHSTNSGYPLYGRAGVGGRGTIIAGALEMSNVDLAKEFTDMIVAQRGFQANSRIITVADEMLQELVNLKR